MRLCDPAHGTHPPTNDFMEQPETLAPGSQQKAGSLASLPPLEGDLKDILMRTCLTLAPVGRRLHELKLYEVPRRIEEEQAAALHWMLNLYFAHGKEWMSEGNKILGWKRPENATR